MALVTTIIDGQELEVERDTWALDACRRLGKEIPTLCHHPALEPYGACRLCVVEVRKGNREPWLATSCDLPIREGLDIRTDTEAVHKARRTAMELLLAEAPDAPALRDMAERLGVRESRFAPRQPDNRCILCGLCVRACRDLIGVSAIGFSGRGPDRRIGSPFDVQTDACIGCLACVAVCPTDAIRVTDRDGVRVMETFHTELAMVPCESCGRPAMPGKMLDYLRERLPEGVPCPALCPSCRQESTAQAVGMGAAAALTARYPEGCRAVEVSAETG
ncbi:MAG: 2Fe-2S iron-sulfur cluster-binding protein [Phycisphaerae bacterium]